MNPVRRLVGNVRFRRRLSEFAQKVAAVRFEEAGIDEDGDPFVRTREATFYGHVTKDAYRAAHRMLPGPVRDRLPIEAFQVALDVVIRYQEGALSYGGPAKQRNHRVREGGTVAEMGAYLGHYSMRLAHQVGRGGRVLAIEANPHNHRILRKNLEVNGLDQVTLVQKGVWNRPDVLEFSIRPEDHQSTSVVLERTEKEVARVPVETLDRILADAQMEAVDLMIIQLNGAEPEALEGLTEVRPDHFAIASRYSAKGEPTTPRVLSILQARGYHTSVVEDDYIFADLPR